MVAIIRPLKYWIAAPTATAVILLLAAQPGLAESTDWKAYRDAYLGPKRNDLMVLCAKGRQINAAGESYWMGEWRSAIQETRLLLGETQAEIDAKDAGKAAAMSQVCPEVR